MDSGEKTRRTKKVPNVSDAAQKHPIDDGAWGSKNDIFIQWGHTVANARDIVLTIRGLDIE